MSEHDAAILAEHYAHLEAVQADVLGLVEVWRWVDAIPVGAGAIEAAMKQMDAERDYYVMVRRQLALAIHVKGMSDKMQVLIANDADKEERVATLERLAEARELGRQRDEWIGDFQAGHGLEGQAS